MILNIAKNYFETDKGKLRNQTKNKYRELFEEEINIERKYGRNRHLNMSKEKKQKLQECQKIIVRLRSLSLVLNKM